MAHRQLGQIFVDLGFIDEQALENGALQTIAINPARIFGLYPRKGHIGTGSDADIIVFDPGTAKTIRAAEMHSAADWDPFEGW